MVIAPETCAPASGELSFSAGTALVTVTVIAAVLTTALKAE